MLVCGFAVTLGLVAAFAPRGYVRVDASLLDASGTPVTTSSAIALVSPRWFGYQTYGVVWRASDPKSTPFPNPDRLQFALVSTHRSWWPWRHRVTPSTGGVRIDPDAPVANGTRTAGELALRCASPVAIALIKNDRAISLMTFDSQVDAEAERASK